MPLQSICWYFFRQSLFFQLNFFFSIFNMHFPSLFASKFSSIRFEWFSSLFFCNISLFFRRCFVLRYFVPVVLTSFVTISLFRCKRLYPNGSFHVLPPNAYFLIGLTTPFPRSRIYFEMHQFRQYLTVTITSNRNQS